LNKSEFVLACSAILFVMFFSQVALADNRGWPVEGQFNWYDVPKFGNVGTPVAQDLDGDGFSEVIVLMEKYDPAGQPRVEVHVFDKDGEPYSGSWPKEIYGERLLGTVALAAPMIADIDPVDSTLEIVVTLYNYSSSTLKVHVLNHDGTFFWGTPFERNVTHSGFSSGVDFSPGAVGDLDDDGTLEIIAAIGDEVFVIRNDKTTLFEKKLNQATHYISSAPAVADLNQDGKPELVLNYDKYYVWQHDGSSLPGWPLPIPGSLQLPSANISPVVGDLDNDGDFELVFASIWAHFSQTKVWIYAYHHDGTVVDGWPVEDLGGGGAANRFNTPALADIDNDGKLEVITLKAGVDNEVCVYRHDATLAPGWPQPVNLNGLASFYYIANSYTPSVGDVDGDGKSEITVVAMNPASDTLPSVYLFNADGTDVANFPHPTEEGSMLGSIPSMVDLDNDDVAEILFSYYRITGQSSGIVSWHIELLQNIDWQSHDEEKMFWPGFQRDAAHSGTLPPYPLALSAGHIQAGTGGIVDFVLNAGSENTLRNYLVLGGVTGTEPGFPLPGGEILPLNWDAFTDAVMAWVNTPLFANFMGTLDELGMAAAQLNAPPIDPQFVGVVMHYSFCVNNPFDFVSNPVEIEIIH